MATHAQRQHVLHLLDYLNAHRALLDYPPGDQRTSRDGISWHLTETQLDRLLSTGGRWQGDCSELGSYVLKLAGLWHWPEPGYTGSHLQLLRPVYTNARVANIGALVIFGGGTGHHEAVVHTPDPVHGNPILGSHGRPGFDLVRLSDLAAEQAASGHPGVRFCSIANL